MTQTEMISLLEGAKKNGIIYGYTLNDVQVATVRPYNTPSETNVRDIGNLHPKALINTLIDLTKKKFDAMEEKQQKTISSIHQEILGKENS